MPPPPPPSQRNGGKVTPNLAMDAEAMRLLNLTLLQHLDPAIEDIFITADLYQSISGKKKCKKPASRKIHKAEREKLKRDHLNDLFVELGNMLGCDMAAHLSIYANNLEKDMAAHSRVQHPHLLKGSICGK